MRSLRFFSAALAVLLAVAVTSALEPARTTRNLSLQDCIQIALEHNLDVQIQRINPELARYALGVSYGNYDPNFGFSGDHSRNISPGGVDTQGRAFGGTESETDRFSSSLQGLLPWGLTYNLGGTMADRTGTQPAVAPDFSNPTVVTNSFTDIGTGDVISYRSTNFGSTAIRVPFETTSADVGALTLRQPLLKNFWIDSTRLQIMLNKQNIKISELDLRLQVITTVTDVEQAYFDLIHAEESVKVQREAMNLAERLVTENRRRVEVGALAPLDSKQAESQAASARADLLAAQSTRDTTERVLKNLLSDDYNVWENVTIQPSDALLAIPQQFSLQESWRIGLEQRPDLLAAKLSLEKQGYIVRYQKNQLYPQLDLIGAYGYNASSTEYSGALGQISSADNPFYTVGAQMTIPLGNTSARNSLKSARATKDQIALQLKQLQQGTLIRIENAIAVAETSFQRVDATRQARQYAESALEAEQTKLDKGKSTTFVVLQLQKDLTDARSAEIRALADYNIALARLALNEGSTLDRRRINLQVGR